MKKHIYSVLTLTVGIQLSLSAVDAEPSAPPMPQLYNSQPASSNDTHASAPLYPTLPQLESQNAAENSSNQTSTSNAQPNTPADHFAGDNQLWKGFAITLGKNIATSAAAYFGAKSFFYGRNPGHWEYRRNHSYYYDGRPAAERKGFRSASVGAALGSMYCAWKDLKQVRSIDQIRAQHANGQLDNFITSEQPKSAVAVALSNAQTTRTQGINAENAAIQQDIERYQRALTSFNTLPNDITNLEGLQQRHTLEAQNAYTSYLKINNASAHQTSERARASLTDTNKRLAFIRTEYAKLQQEFIDAAHCELQLAHLRGLLDENDAVTEERNRYFNSRIADDATIAPERMEQLRNQKIAQANESNKSWYYGSMVANLLTACIASFCAIASR